MISGQDQGTGDGSAVRRKSGPPRPPAVFVAGPAARYVAVRSEGGFEVVWNGETVGVYRDLATAERVYLGRARLDQLG